MRRTFSPTLWTGMPRPGQDVSQMWFSGVHADVGGGYRETGLSNITLRWMIERAAACGAAFHDYMLDQIKPDPQDVMHDSLQGFAFRSALTQPRGIPNLDDENARGPTGQQMHYSVFYRRGQPPIFQAPYSDSPSFERDGKYGQWSRLNVGETVTLTIYAGQKWNWTGIYFEKNTTYKLSASGEWVDGLRKYPVAGSCCKGFMTRYPHAPFFSLVGSIVDFANPNIQGDIQEPIMFTIGSDAQYSTQNSEGYFYAFTNDRVFCYGNNRGSVTLNVKRLG